MRRLLNIIDNLVLLAVLVTMCATHGTTQPYATTNRPFKATTKEEIRAVYNESKTVTNNVTVTELTGLFLCDITYDNEAVIVDCSSRNIVFIPALPLDATSVNLSNNQITMVINSAAFLGLYGLQELDLSDNPLQFIPDTLFKGLYKLTTLLMRNTLLYKQETLVLDTQLAGLGLLRHFSFTFPLPESTRFSPVPCTVYHKSQPFGKIDTLQNVETLEIDSTLIRWPSNITSEKVTFHAKTLHLINGVNCYYGQLNSSQFDYMPFLENLYIENPFLTAAVTGEFVSSNRHLKKLVIHGPNAPYSFAAKFIYNVTEAISNLTNMTNLNLEGISDNIRMNFHCCIGVYPLTALRSLTNLSLADNSLTFNYPEECEQFPPSLKHVYLQRNCVSNKEINYNILLFNKQVETVEARDQSNCAFMEQIGEKDFTTRNKNRPYHKHRHGIKYDIKEYKLARLVLTNSTDALDFGDENDNFIKLKYLDLSLNNKMSMTVIPYFFSTCRPILKYLNLSDSCVGDLQEHSLSNLSKLETLDLSVNLLGKMGCSLCDRLLNLSSLRALNLANNGMYCLTSYMFDGMANIRKIDLGGNEIQHFDASLTHTRNLEYLDLSGNRLEKLSQRSMAELDQLSSSQKISLDLYGNSLLCNCDTLEFLQWMKDSHVHFVGKEKYSCTFANGSETSLDEVQPIVDYLKSHCSSNTVVVVIISVAAACCVASICGAAVNRYRWRLRYWYYKTKIKIPYTPSGPEYEQVFDYDGFISYSSEDNQIARDGTIHELEIVRGMRLCIHERDFKPGESIAFNISRGIHNSKRTILFLSKAFLASEWCMYEFNIARMESLHTGRKVILVVMLENIPSKQLPVDVLDIIDTTTYLEYPRNGSEAVIEAFWSKCADFVTDI